MLLTKEMLVFRNPVMSIVSSLITNKTFRALFPPLLLLLIIVIVFKEAAFFIHPLKWDALDCTMPWKYFISTCFADGVFPFWNPYQHVGYPFYGDAQSTLYYPVTFVMTYFHGYTFKMLTVDYIFHVWAGATGMYFLGRSFKFSGIIAFILAVAYAFSGFMIGNAQHIYWIISAAWLPFVLIFYIRMQHERRIWQALLLSLFLYLMISGGYPAFVIVLAYIFAIVYFVKAIRLLKERKSNEFWNYTLLHGLVSVFTIGLSCLYLVTFFDNYSFSDRADGLMLSQVLQSPFSLESFISFILPLTTIKGFEHFGTDLSMANGYIGLFIFCFFILSLFKRKNPVQKLILWISLVCLIISVGEKTYLREFLYHYVPLFDSFRFPSAFRLFVITGFILSAGFYLQSIEKNDNPAKLNKPLLLILIPAALFFVFSIFQTADLSAGTMFQYIRSVKTGDFSLSIGVLKFVQSILILVLLFLFFGLMMVFKSMKNRLIIIAVFVVLDAGLTARMLAPYTVYSPDLKISELNEFANQHFVKTYPQPDMTTDVMQHSDTSSVRRYGLWRNLNNYYGQFAHGGFSSYVNRNIQLMEISFPEIYSAALRHRPVYVSECTKPYSLMGIADSISFCDYTDAVQDSNVHDVNIAIVSYNPNRIEFNVNTPEPALVCYLQSWHKYWTATVNGIAREPKLVNRFHLGVMSDAGNNTIVFEFRPRYFYTALIISLVTFVVLMGLLIITAVRKF
ncbi:MAG: YfhO family protein [Bacteroidales bacterium]|nr:YfhO family protein [Bacteroidales bacterium]